MVSVTEPVVCRIWIPVIVLDSFDWLMACTFYNLFVLLPCNLIFVADNHGGKRFSIGQKPSWIGEPIQPAAK